MVTSVCGGWKEPEVSETFDLGNKEKVKHRVRQGGGTQITDTLLRITCIRGENAAPVLIIQQSNREENKLIEKPTSYHTSTL